MSISQQKNPHLYWKSPHLQTNFIIKKGSDEYKKRIQHKKDIKDIADGESFSHIQQIGLDKIRSMIIYSHVYVYNLL